MDFLGRRKIKLLLLGVILSGAALRIYHIGFSLPYVTHPDEGRYLPTAISMLSRLDFNPKYFENPPFLSYIYAFATCLYFIIWKISSLFLKLPNFKELWENDPTTFYIMARTINVIFGVGTCLVAYRIAKKIFNETIGIISCALLSFCYLHLRDSHYAVNDVPSVFFMVLAFKYIVDVWAGGGTKSYVLAGIMSGIAVATKYNVGIIVVPFLTAYLLKQHYKEAEGRRRFFIFFIFCLIGFYIGCPWIILDAKMFFKGFLSTLSYSKQPWLGCSAESSYIQFLKTLLWGYGVVPCLFLAIGSAVLAMKKQVFLLLMIFPFTYYILLGASKLFFVRFAIPLIPFLCITSAYGIAHSSGYFSKFQKNRVIIFLTLIAILQGFIFSIRHDYLIGETDTRVIARTWVRKNIPSGSKILTEGYCPNLKDFVKDGSVKSYTFKEVWTDLPKKNIRDYIGEGYEFIVTSDFVRKRYTADKERYPIESNFYSALDVDAEKVFSSDTCGKKIPFYFDEIYSPFWNLFILERPGPCINIYKITGLKIK